MTLLTDIRKDREAGTPGPWRAERPHFANGWWVVFTDPYTDATVDESGDGGFSEQTARRIARVPQLEEIALAAERVMQCATVANQQGLISKGVSVDLAEALAPLRDLLEGETHE